LFVSSGFLEERDLAYLTILVVSDSNIFTDVLFASSWCIKG